MIMNFTITFLLLANLAIAVLSSPVLNATCTISSFDEVANVVASCSDIVLESFTVPAGTTLNMNLNSGSTVTVKGVIKFGYQEWAGPLVQIYGNQITFRGAGGYFDGEGANYWDGDNKNGKVKPKFFKIKTKANSIFSDITLKNCPKNCVSISASDTTLTDWLVDCSEGDSKKGKNTDGFDLASSADITIRDSVVMNQDDCVAINQGSNFLFERLTCSGGHGLSLSVGLSKSNGEVNTVRNATFTDCVVKNSKNGMHIKTHNDTGAITDITYRNIKLSGIENYGIEIQENYPNGGDPVGNVPITNLNLESVSGNMSGAKNSMAVYILCADGGCNNWSWSNVAISNSKKANSCNFTPNGFSC
ncbi:polygalacturonase-like isoform X1 [Sitophilus oryzae]|uniref:endo-polygalacturonase n=1 Tax=Sitophilus oryzae TaxID=7048 RepID=A0A6J2YWN3_SITOR|nr:polygalacturonase-like isoform X1 [Sitophilus oryzae]